MVVSICAFIYNIYSTFSLLKENSKYNKEKGNLEALYAENRENEDAKGKYDIWIQENENQQKINTERIPSLKNEEDHVKEMLSREKRGLDKLLNLKDPKVSKFEDFAEGMNRVSRPEEKNIQNIHEAVNKWIQLGDDQIRGTKSVPNSEISKPELNLPLSGKENTKTLNEYTPADAMADEIKNYGTQINELTDRIARYEGEIVQLNGNNKDLIATKEQYLEDYNGVEANFKLVTERYNAGVSQYTNFKSSFCKHVSCNIIGMCCSVGGFVCGMLNIAQSFILEADL